MISNLTPNDFQNLAFVTFYQIDSNNFWHFDPICAHFALQSERANLHVPVSVATLSALNFDEMNVSASLIRE